VGRLTWAVAGRSEMKKEKRKKLEAAGWTVGGTRQFLNLTPEEAEFVKVKLALARPLRAPRERH